MKQIDCSYNNSILGDTMIFYLHYCRMLGWVIIIILTLADRERLRTRRIYNEITANHFQRRIVLFKKIFLHRF